MSNDTFSCCDQYHLLNFSMMENPLTMIYWDEPTLWTAAFSIVITPLYWILISQLEYHTHGLRRLFCSRHVAVFIFAISVILILSYRNIKFLVALQHQPKWIPLQENPILWLGHALFIIGILLVLRSFMSLGFIATYMGDHFGLRLTFRVTKFPYSWMNHPMYSGSFMMFMGLALVDTSQAGILLALLAGFMYILAAWWEESYTDQIYLSCPKITRTVGVQVSCTTQILEIAARTVCTQTGGDVQIMDAPEFGDFEVEIEEMDVIVETRSSRNDAVLASASIGIDNVTTSETERVYQTKSLPADVRTKTYSPRMRHKRRGKTTQSAVEINKLDLESTKVDSLGVRETVAKGGTSKKEPHSLERQLEIKPTTTGAGQSPQQEVAHVEAEHSLVGEELLYQQPNEVVHMADRVEIHAEGPREMGPGTEGAEIHAEGPREVEPSAKELEITGEDTKEVEPIDERHEKAEFKGQEVSLHNKEAEFSQNEVKVQDEEPTEAETNIHEMNLHDEGTEDMNICSDQVELGGEIARETVPMGAEGGQFLDRGAGDTETSEWDKSHDEVQHKTEGAELPPKSQGDDIPDVTHLSGAGQPTRMMKKKKKKRNKQH